MPPLSPEAALALAEAHWRIQGTVSPLPSYADQNFRIDTGNARYVLKFAHASWSRQDLDLENQAMLTLCEREPALAWPQVQFTRAGEHLLTLDIDGEQRHVRLLSYVPGEVYANAAPDLPVQMRKALHHRLGDAVGRLTRGLQDFKHPAAGRQHEWNLMHLPVLLDEIVNIEDGEIRGIVDTHARAFCAKLPVWLESLPIQVLHNDANDLNVIVVIDANNEPQVSSVIDFGDMCTSFRLADLAIACTYAMQHEDDPVTCAQTILQGYLAQCPLTGDEMQALQAFIVARLCHSVLMATRAYRMAPGNDFILVSQQGVRALLCSLVAVDPGAITTPFQSASSLELPHA